MTVAFRELGGSPVEWYDVQGFHARREFLVAWEDRDAFAVEILGEAAQYGSTTWVNYPGKNNVFAVKLRYEPVEADHPDLQDAFALAEGLNAYSDSLAKAVVEYETVNPLDRPDGPGNEIGTHLTYRMLFAAEYQKIGSGGWSWLDTSAAVPSNLELAKWIPTTEHHLTWHQVINPPWDVIHALQGTVNAAEFLGCPAGTLLFEGADANKLFRAGFAEGESPFCWQIGYLFRERSIKHGGSVYGWNHAYRETPAGWAEVTNGAEGLYAAADFLPLFQSAAG
jgi:hypothetical protein